MISVFLQAGIISYLYSFLFIMDTKLLSSREALTILGKKNKALRRKGYLPAIIYGHRFNNIPLQLKKADFAKVLKEAGETTIIKLSIDGKKNEEQKKFLELLDSLPQTTALVLVVEDTLVTKRDKSYWEKLSARHWLIKWVKGAGGRAWIKDCALPTSREMTGWVQRKVKELGGEFRADAAARLAEYVGTNTQRAVQEITKLLTYVNYAKPVTAEDVALLTAQDQEGNIFDLVDAIGERNGCKALEALQILLETNDALDLFGMIARQFRLLLEAREIIDEGGDAGQVRNDLNLHPYVARKISTQASRFTMPKLEEIYRRLLKIDLDMKTGGMPGDVAFEVLIAELTG